MVNPYYVPQGKSAGNKSGNTFTLRTFWAVMVTLLKS